MIAIKIIGWLLLVFVNVYVDWYLIERRKVGIMHLPEFILRGMAAILYGGFVFDAQQGWHGFHVISFEALSFWLLFEHSLNLARGKAWDYLGTTAASDKFFRENRPLYYMLKIIAIGILIINIRYLINF